MGPLPELSPLAEQALHCYAWCGGWEPGRWAVYAALYPVHDWEALSDLMQGIRDEQRAADAGGRRG